MADTLVTAALPNNNGVAKDAIRWAIAVNIGGLSAGDVQTLFNDWWNVDLVGSGHHIHDMVASCMNAATSAGAVQLRAYDITGHLDGSPHGSPYITTTSQLTTTGGDSRGNQLAVTLEYHASSYSTTPVQGPSGAIPTQGPKAVRTAMPTHTGVTKLQSRRSGRWYLGPLDGSVVGVDGNANPELTGTWKAFLPAQMIGFLTAHTEWCVWSRRDAALYPVADGWVDYSITTRRHRAWSGAGRATW